MGQHVKELVPAMLHFDPELRLHVVAPTFDQDESRIEEGRLVVQHVPVSRPELESFYDDVERANQLLGIVAMRIVAEEGPFDVMHVHDWLTGWAGFAVQERYGIPLVTTIHATERGRGRGFLHHHMSGAIDQAESNLAHRSDAIITCSRAMQLEVERYFGVAPDRISVIPNGVDGQRFNGLRAAVESGFRKRFAEPHERIVFNVGRLVYEKGADLLIEAVPLVLAQAPNTRFVIAGQGPLWPTLQQRVAALQVESQVVLTGFLSDQDRDSLYAVADCCVFPSRYEPFGIVALEAMAAGAPVVVADVDGLASVVTHEKTGLTAYADDVGSLAWAIVQTLADAPSAAMRAAAARARLEESFSWRAIAELTLERYRIVAAAAG
jgi:glycosyltransferase involved in cell wall biosynthesis